LAFGCGWLACRYTGRWNTLRPLSAIPRLGADQANLAARCAPEGLLACHQTRHPEDMTPSERDLVRIHGQTLPSAEVTRCAVPSAMRGRLAPAPRTRVLLWASLLGDPVPPACGCLPRRAPSKGPEEQPITFLPWAPTRHRRALPRRAAKGGRRVKQKAPSQLETASQENRCAGALARARAPAACGAAPQALSAPPRTKHKKRAQNADGRLNGLRRLGP
jgi:hypothetical protein